MRYFVVRVQKKLGLMSQIDWLRWKGCTIGDGCAVMNDVYIDPGAERYITLGHGVTLAPFVKLIAHDASTKRHLGYTRFRPIVIGNDTFIGAGTIILPGVTIGSSVIVGAGSVVTKDIPSFCVVSGNPAIERVPLETFLDKRAEELVIQGTGGEWRV